MPTNIIRQHNRRPPAATGAKARTYGAVAREIFIHAGAVVIRARLLATPTADRIWAALPIYSTAETFGSGAVHFEIPVSSGREPAARALVKPGEIAFQSDDDRVMIAFAKTPISRPGEIRLPSPSNVWAIALDDVGGLKGVVGGQRVALLEAAS
jgi:hypothetical protein